jgi:DNA polymerase-3 subunit delta
MKIETRQIAGFMRDPGSCRVVLLYGEDEGLIRERARHLTKLIAGTLNDPFRVVELDRNGWPSLAEETTAMSMIGGRRVVRVNEVTDAALEPVRGALKSRWDALLILEAPGLGKGKLRSLVEALPDGAAIGCYAEEGRALQDSIRAMLAETGVSADADAVVWLAESALGDRSVVRGEVEKLALLAGAGGRIDLATARQCGGDSAGASADEGLLAATQGNAVEADRAIEGAIAEGLAAIALIRMALAHLQKLHVSRLRVQSGLSAADAVRSLRPPVFYRSVGGMTASLGIWSADALSRAIEEGRQVEIACKQTGARQELLVRRFVAWLARQAQARVRGPA